MCGPEKGYLELLTRLKASEMAPFLTKCTYDLTHVTSMILLPPLIVSQNILAHFSCLCVNYIL